MIAFPPRQIFKISRRCKMIQLNFSQKVTIIYSEIKKYTHGNCVNHACSCDAVMDFLTSMSFLTAERVTCVFF